jgi:hypothetical protein
VKQRGLLVWLLSLRDTEGIPASCPAGRALLRDEWALLGMTVTRGLVEMRWLAQ